MRFQLCYRNAAFASWAANFVEIEALGAHIRGDRAVLVLNLRFDRRATDGECHIVQIVVRDNNVDQALKALKKKMQREGLFREMKRRNHFEKPSEKRAREKAEAVRRARKLARKRAQREGLLPKT